MRHHIDRHSSSASPRTHGEHYEEAPFTEANEMADFFNEDYQQDEFYDNQDMPEEIAHIADWQEIYESGGNIYDSMRVMFPDLQMSSDEEVEATLVDLLEVMSPEEQERFWRSMGRAFKKVGRAVAPVIKTVAPIAGGAIGTIYGGPVGAKLGSTLGGMVGNATGSLIANASRRRPLTKRRLIRARYKARPSVRRQQTRRYRGNRSPFTGASTKLLRLLEDPQIHQLLLGLARGKNVYRSSGGESVAAEVIISAIQAAATETLEEIYDEGLAADDTFHGLKEEHFDDSSDALSSVLEMIDEGADFSDTTERGHYEYQ